MCGFRSDPDSSHCHKEKKRKIIIGETAYTIYFKQVHQHQITTLFKGNNVSLSLSGIWYSMEGNRQAHWGGGCPQENIRCIQKSDRCTGKN